MDDGSLKQLGEDLWANKPLLIALVIVVGGFAFILIRNSQARANAASPAVTTDNSMPMGSSTSPNNGATYVEGSTPYAPIIIQLPGTPVPSTPVTSPTPAPVTTPTTTPLPPAATTPTAKYVTVQKWPAKLSTLWGIAQASGVSLQQIKSLNPQIANPNLIYAGQQVRVQ